jgi:hypothetical protein
VEQAQRRCGRPTKTGTKAPCKQLLNSGIYACRQHATEVDHAKAEAFREGADWMRELLREVYVKPDPKPVEIQEPAPVKSLRMRDAEGRQLVVVDGRYAYAWGGGSELKVGDQLQLPGAWWNGHAPWIGQVTQLGTDYDGYILSALYKIAK